MNKLLRTFTLFSITWLLVSQVLYAQEDIPLYVTGDFEQVDMISFLNALEAQVPAKFYYKHEWFARHTVNLNLQAREIRDAIGLAIGNLPFTYRILNGNQFVFMPKQAVAEITGQLQDFSNGTDAAASYVMIGDPDEAGRYRSVDVTGAVTDGSNGEPVIGATIQIENMMQGAVTDVDGRYELSVSPGIYMLIISSVGYESVLQQVRVLSHGELNVELFDKSIAIEDVVIFGQRVDRNVTSHQMSLLELDTRTIKQLPVISGGKDIIKGLTMMPGVKSVGEFSSGINVRGGGEDQNLYLINGSPLFNTSHVFGLFSVVNPDMVDKLTLYKGHIPAIYGERVSSVIDIRTKETVPESWTVRGGIGLYDSRLMIEMPVIKEKVFLNLGGRSAYSNWILKHINDADLRNSKAFFYDLNGTLNVNLNRHRFSLSAYSSFDDFTFNDEISYAYGSMAGSFGWNYIISNNLASYLTLSYSDYEVQEDDILEDYSMSRITSGITHSALRYRLKYSGIARNVFDIGFNAINYSIRPGRQQPLGEMSLVSPSALDKEQGAEGAFFINDEYTISHFLTINAGLRVSGYAYLGPRTVLSYMPDMPRDSSTVNGLKQFGKNDVIQSYFGAEPRVSARIQLSKNTSVKLSYDRNFQYLSLISNSSVSTPSDIWKLSDTYIKPLIANQFAIGFYRNFMNNTIETSVEAYYKNLVNVIEYKNGVDLSMVNNIETQLIPAEGKNFGIEFLLRKNTGKVEGWMTYTYSRSLRRTTGSFSEETINEGAYFPSSYDRPHDFTIVANFHVNKRVSLSANFTYSTGRPITLPEYKFAVRDEYVVYFSDKNKYRIPDYHRLDLTLRIDESLRIRKKWKGSWSFSILNLYGRKNAYTVFYKEEIPAPQNDYNRFSLYKLYLIGRPIPTITYNFIF